MQPLIQCSRVYLRELNSDDWSSVHSYGSDSRVVEFQAWGPHSERDSKDWVNLAVSEQTKVPRQMYYFGICFNETDEMIGGVGVHRMESAENRGSAEIGYSIRPDYWHRGLGREAVGALIALIFETTDLFRLTAHCRDSNLSSIRLLEALGFRREGHFIQDTWVRGKLMNSYWYALLKQEVLDARRSYRA